VGAQLDHVAGLRDRIGGHLGQVVGALPGRPAALRGLDELLDVVAREAHHREPVGAALVAEQLP
jgi:hypothetical protein